MKKFIFIPAFFCINISLYGAALDSTAEAVQKAPLNITAVVMFILFVLATLIITYFANKKTHSTEAFFTAGGGISGFQNGLAIAGDYMSAAAFLGLTALIFSYGFDSLIYPVGWTIAWPVILFLIAERFRNLGKFTFTDVIALRLEEKPIRIVAALSTLTIVILYLIAQMVGAGQLIQTLFGLPYSLAVVFVGILMMCYVIFGGMHATTWVQIIKASLLLGGTTLMALMILYMSNFDLKYYFDLAINNHPKGADIMKAGVFFKDPIATFSLGLAVTFGTAGLPHILMRFFTVKNASEARKSAFFATGFIAYFFLLMFVLGFGAIAFVLGDPQYVDEAGKFTGATNMVVIILAEVLGGNVLLAFISAVSFATILAVVSGLCISGAGAIAHDLYTQTFKSGKADGKTQMAVSKIATIILGVLSIVLGFVFENINVAFMVGLIFGIAGSVNFPIILLCIYWKGLTSRGVFLGGLLGLLAVVSFVFLSPSMWEKTFGLKNAIFPYDHPAIFSIPLTFFLLWFFSITDKSKRAQIDKEGYKAFDFRAKTGIGASEAVSH
ncbi:cation/acetate symporter ActP [Campylobacter cuniculorum]|uniref:Cation/acetate symporter ActP n=2 Tax=Campylobacter cuniculorum TaxID=374106 RepID=A0ABX6U0I9_9BACT|nr:cation/acetate symporter ActP [Campylobacter cuniculorum]ARJ57222.1 putative cation/acetate symporter ActP [Campylobacter cuniculorum DSM 23162 = LMG 24588]QOR04663.1 cation/acetate symporter ActP [Campylobacter cuniculorum]